MEVDLSKSRDGTSNRACDACRFHKVRCLPNPPNSSFSNSSACLRCLKTDRQCVFTAPQKRKQRKRTDTRVAELEREVQAMRTLFDKKSSMPPPKKTRLVDPEALSSLGLSIAVTPDSLSPAANVASPASTSASPPIAARDTCNWPCEIESSSITSFPDADVIDKGVISLETAGQLFRTYVDDLFPYYPAVTFPPGTLVESVRREKPTLFLAIMAAAAAKTDPHLYRVLHTEVLAAYAYRTVINSEKSLELVQALTVTAVWYYPPGRLGQLKFYEYIHMAVTMGIDLGLGASLNTSRRRRVGSDKPLPESTQGIAKDEREIERKRTFLACYMISAGVAMNMRRPNLMRSSNQVNNCVEYLSVHGNPATLDGVIVAWVKLLQITEDIGSAFSFDDPANIANLAEPHVQLMLNSFEKKLQSWKENLSTNSINVALLLAYHHTEIYLHEVAIHDDHCVEDLTPPYRLDKVISIEPSLQASSSYIKPISVMISSAHALIDIMLNMEVEILRAIPIFNYVRLAYVVLILTKLYISSKAPESQIGLVLDSQTLKLGPYLESIIKKLSTAVGPMECRAPFTFLSLLVNLQIWYRSQENEEHFQKPLELRGVLEHCWLPFPPDLGKKQVSAETTRLDGSSPQTQIQDMDPSQAESLRSMGLMELATMQPLPNFDFDFGDSDINQFSTLDGIDSNLEYDEWMPDVEIPNTFAESWVPETFD